MQASESGHSGLEHFERELVRSLYRFDCPDAHSLGEYQLELLEPAQRVRIAAHAAECDECRAELQMLRSFLVEPISVPETLAGRARRIVASLFAGPLEPAYGGLRGTSDQSTRVYEAGDVSVTIGPGQTSGSLVGLVLATGASADLEGCEVRLIPPGGASIATSLDDLGNFEFFDLASGLYAVEIDLPDGVVVVEELRVD
jgi:hypothetical protein